MQKKKHDAPYAGFEQRPIQPPSQAESLLIRITRNCPWNRCTFCPVYKGKRFSLRPPEHVIRDMESPHLFREAENSCRELGITPENVDGLIDTLMNRFI